MEQASVSLFTVATVATALSFLAYCAHTIGLRPSTSKMITAPIGTAGAAVSEPARWPGAVATFLASLAAGLLVLAMILRWLASGYVPWSNMWEYTVAFAGGIIIAYLAFEKAIGDKRLGTVVLPVALSLMLTAMVFFPSDIRPLVPALQNRDVLAAHVGVLILAYAAFTVSFGAAVLHIVQRGARRRFASLPPARFLEDVAFRSVAAGFPLLTAGIALGAYWADTAWGRYWGWDPKETSILVSWLIYGAYLHMRGLRKWSGTRSALVLVAGYASILFSYFAVNLFVAGLHSYAGV